MICCLIGGIASASSLANRWPELQQMNGSSAFGYVTGAIIAAPFWGLILWLLWRGLVGLYRLVARPFRRA